MRGGWIRIVRRQKVVFAANLEDGHFDARPQKGVFPGGNAITGFLRDEESRSALASYADRLEPLRRKHFRDKGFYRFWCQDWCDRNGVDEANILYSLLQFLELQLLEEESSSMISTPTQAMKGEYREFWYTVDLTSGELHIHCSQSSVLYQFPEIPTDEEIHIRLYNPGVEDQERKLNQLEKFESAEKSFLEFKRWLFYDGKFPEILYPF